MLERARHIPSLTESSRPRQELQAVLGLELRL
jgi:hypothetical protein